MFLPFEVKVELKLTRSSQVDVDSQQLCRLSAGEESHLGSCSIVGAP